MKNASENHLSHYITPFLVIIFVAWGAILYSDSIANLWHQWQTPEYGHGILLPLISELWAIYLLQIKPVVLKAAPFGLFMILGALVLNIIGIIISNNWLSNLSILFFIYGMVILFLGFKAFRCVLPALALLFFAIPLPVTLLPALTADLQLISSSLGVSIIQLLGMPVYQEGNIIDLGGHKLDVAIACSGLQYLFPLLSLSYLVAFLSFKSWWKRITLFLSAIPITLAMNAARIALSGLIYNWFGSDAIEGLMHYVEGYVVFALCLIVLLIVKYILNYIPPHNDKNSISDASFNFKNLLNYGYNAPKLWIIFCLLTVMIAVTFSTNYINQKHDMDVAIPRKSFIDFPLNIGNWTGSKSQLNAIELQTLNLTDHFVGNYNYKTNKSFTPINLYIAYYDKQTQENSIHSPQICLPGSGWIITSHSIHTVGKLNVNKEIMQKNNEKLLVYYWFKEAGYDAASNWEIKKLLLINSLRNGRTDGSLIRITAQITDNNDVKNVEEQMDDFLQNLLPLLSGYLPSPSTL